MPWGYLHSSPIPSGRDAPVPHLCRDRICLPWKHHSGGHGNDFPDSLGSSNSRQERKGAARGYESPTNAETSLLSQHLKDTSPSQVCDRITGQPQEIGVFCRGLCCRSPKTALTCTKALLKGWLFILFTLLTQDTAPQINFAHFPSFCFILLPKFLFLV